MTWIVLGLALWWGAHLFKRLAPARRAAMGDAGKGLVAGLVLASVVLMVVGYRGAEQVDLWYPPSFLTHVNNLLMLVAVYLYVASGAKTAITGRMHHPQLTAVKIWAVAHLLVNGDAASLLLFGGLLAWAVVSVIVINRAETEWVPAQGWPIKGEVVPIVVTLVVFAGIAWVHNWLGYWPFG